MPLLSLPDADLSYTLAGTGEPVLFIQGVGVTGSGWRPQVDALSSHFTCLAFDNRSIGASSSRVPTLSISQMAADALALMDAPAFPAAHVVGHSMGGVIAQELALCAPHRVKSLSLICTFSSGREVRQLSPKMLWLGIRSRLGSARMRRRAFLHMLFPPRYLAGRDLDRLATDLEPLIGRDLATQPPIVMRQLQALGHHDCSARLRELAPVPTLVVSAQHDPIARPLFGHRLARSIPRAHYVEIPNASHGVTIQDPALVNGLLREHFSKGGVVS